VKKRVITQEHVIQKGIELANQAGSVEQITLKELATALNIKVPSLYNHVQGTKGLIQALRLRGLQMMLTELRQAAFGKTGDDALFAVAIAYRAFAQQNPAIYPLTQQAPLEDDDPQVGRLAQEFVQFVTLLLPYRQLDEVQLIHAIRGLRALLHGFVMLETAQGFGLPVAIEASFEHLLQTYLTGLQHSKTGN
jgi:AcrR family transcriptional regulator